ncbi:MAG TPA: universal stress protein [Nocardioides sp.]|uniref:universal stress protein n=1 Tax=Nocardioides sp. TaxID=35761 RepID=UPI002BC49E58|nr:universal stress protein [Nocardioides sp.]HTW13863.1 universal stress protein [Nocardioides sp.]
MDEVANPGEPTAVGHVVAAVGRWPDDQVVVERAAAEAGSRGVQLTLLHVDEGLEGPAAGHAGAHVDESSQALVDASTWARRAVPDVHCRTAVLAGPIAMGIIGMSRTARLVVLGSEGASPLVKLARGAVTSDVAARSHCPVEVVPRNTDEDLPVRPPTRVVALVREHAELEDLVPTALAEAARCELPLAILHSAGDTAPAERENLREQLRSDIARWRRRFPTVPTDVVVVPGHAPVAISGLLGRGDIVALVRRQSATFWGRPDRDTRALLDEHVCRVLVLPMREHDRTTA